MDVCDGFLAVGQREAARDRAPVTDGIDTIVFGSVGPLGGFTGQTAEKISGSRWID